MNAAAFPRAAGARASGLAWPARARGFSRAPITETTFMLGLKIARPAAIAAVLITAGLCSGTPAAAGNTATRCGAYGCTAIHCNYTGDRCYRIDGDERYGGRYERSGYRYDGDDERGGYYRSDYRGYGG